MNLNGKLRKKLGGPNRVQAKIWGGHGPPLESPLMRSGSARWQDYRRTYWS